jgi:hypothetical protein
MDELAGRALIAWRLGDEVEPRGTAKPGWPNFSSTSTAGDELGPLKQITRALQASRLSWLRIEPDTPPG